MRRHRRDPEAGAEVRGRTVRQPDGLCCGQGNELRRRSLRPAPLRPPEPYALAHPRCGDIAAHRNDLAGAVVVGHDALMAGVEAVARPRSQIGRVDAGHPDAYQHLFGAGLRSLDLDDVNLTGAHARGRILGSKHPVFGTHIRRDHTRSLLASRRGQGMRKPRKRWEMTRPVEFAAAWRALGRPGLVALTMLLRCSMRARSFP